MGRSTLKTLLLVAVLAAAPALAADVICSDGLRISVSEDPIAGTMRLSAGDEDLLAFKAVGDQDPRWVAGEVTIRRQGDDMTLSGGRYVKVSCRNVPDAPTAGVLVGTVAKRDRMALPPGTTIKVLLADVSRADAPMREVARAEIVTRGSQVPYHFLIRYDPARLDLRGTNAVSARVESGDGRLLYITDTHFQGPKADAAPIPVDLLVVPVTSGR